MRGREIRTAARLLTALLLLLGCDAAAPTAPTGSYLIPHDARFYALWSDLQSCSGLTRNPDRTRRFLAPGDRVQMANGTRIAAYYQPDGDFMVIAEGLRDDDRLLAHEMLHALLIQVLGVRGHPEEYFLVRCGWAGSPHDA